MRFEVEGMTCGHCVATIRTAVRAAAPDAKVEFDLDGGAIRLYGPADPARVAASIEEAGYRVRLDLTAETVD